MYGRSSWQRRKKKAREERSELQTDGNRDTRQRVAAFRQRQKEIKVTDIGLFRTYATAYTKVKSFNK